MKYLSFFLLFFCNNIFAQIDSFPYKITWGNETRRPDDSYLYKLVSNGTDGFIGVRLKMANFFSDGTGHIYLESYNSQNNLLKSNKIDMDYSGKTRTFQNIFRWKNELYFLTSYRNKKTEINYLFTQTIDDKLMPTKKLTKIADIEEAGELDDGEFDFRFSKDSSKLLVFSRQPQSRKEPEEFHLQVYSPGFQEVVSHDISLGYASENFSMEDCQVDKMGNVYILGVVYNDASRLKNREKVNYQYVVQFYPVDTTILPTELKLINKENFTSDLTIRLADDGNLIGAGYFSKKGVDGIQGITYLKVNTQTKTIENQTFTPFDIEFLTELMTPKQKKKALNNVSKNDLPELYNYNLDHLVLRSDGGALLIGEQYSVEKVYRNNSYGYGLNYGFSRYNQMDRIDYYYHYDDIIVVNVSPNGAIQWSTHIPKLQTTMNDNGIYSSYSMMVNKDKIYLLFNDNIKNFSNEKSTLYEFNAGKYSVGALAEISKDGESKIYLLKSNDQNNLLIQPKLCRQMQKKGLTLFGEEGKTYHFGKLEF